MAFAKIETAEAAIFLVLAVETVHTFHDCVNTNTAMSMLSTPQVRHSQVQAAITISAIGAALSLATRDNRYLIVAGSAAALMLVSLELIHRWHRASNAYG